MDNGKTASPPDVGFRRTNGGPGGQAAQLINVIPPRREDLQPKYAQTLQAEDDEGDHGWYGSMSKFSNPPHYHRMLMIYSQHSRFLRRIHGSNPMLRRLPQPLQASQPR